MKRERERERERESKMINNNKILLIWWFCSCPSLFLVVFLSIVIMCQFISSGGNMYVILCGFFSNECFVGFDQKFEKNVDFVYQIFVLSSSTNCSSGTNIYLQSQ
jgi:hypothetical protein